ncbi:hypothetical protein HYH02_008376 [Chlamydomonas schloesseri]|uniref:histidine kinase n=1 Tax=Chlamydomonas schloesseri TaxID=2026947 RepID=A0A835WG65_9CHLO|nr:hypothetical protein HYH02_008376 [Chlamydomonas schloesseri]|eukprot:KAG2446816.1 hypothetical protein HYH02_008376 [Chlamydomonas schloesseri]
MAETRRTGAASKGYDMPASPYITGIAEQAQHIQSLQERISELEEALKRERHRADLCEQQLEQCMAAAQQHAAAAAVQQQLLAAAAAGADIGSAAAAVAAAGSGSVLAPPAHLQQLRIASVTGGVDSGAGSGGAGAGGSASVSMTMSGSAAAGAGAGSVGSGLRTPNASAAVAAAAAAALLSSSPRFAGAIPHPNGFMPQVGGPGITGGAAGAARSAGSLSSGAAAAAGAGGGGAAAGPLAAAAAAADGAAGAVAVNAAASLMIRATSSPSLPSFALGPVPNAGPSRSRLLLPSAPSATGSPAAAGLAGAEASAGEQEPAAAAGVAAAGGMAADTDACAAHAQDAAAVAAPPTAADTTVVPWPPGSRLADTSAASSSPAAAVAAALGNGAASPGLGEHAGLAHVGSRSHAVGVLGTPTAAGGHADAASEAAEAGLDGSNGSSATAATAGGLPSAKRCVACTSPDCSATTATVAALAAAAAAATEADSSMYDSGAMALSYGDGEYVTITRREYELLLLKDKAMDVLQEGITIADCSLPDMPLIYANAGFVRTTGYSAAYVLGKNCRFLQGEGTDCQQVIDLKKAISEGKSCVVQLLNYKKNGDPFVNYLSLTPIHDAATGRLTHYVGVQSDITELVNHKKAELAAKHAALQAAVATEAKSQFLARMSHEIRTPLNGMIAVGQLLAETSLTPAQWDLVNTIRCSGETLLTLITDILDFSRIEANKMVLHNAVFKLDTVIEAAMEIAGLKAAQRKLQVAYHISESMPRMLYGDAQRLQQILLNILNNGIKFTEEGELLLEVWAEGVFPPYASSAAAAAAAVPAAVTTAAAAVAAGGEPEAGTDPAAAAPSTTTAAAGPPVAAATVPPPPNGPEADWPLMVIRFSVRDTGIGIAPADLGRLFNSFTQVDASPTRRYGGSGLGLAISRKLCEAMGGQMWVESEGLNRGSTFSWTITCRLPQQASAKRRGRRSSLVCVSRPPLGGAGGAATTAGYLGYGSGGSGPGSAAGGPGSISGIGAMASPRAATVSGIVGGWGAAASSVGGGGSSASVAAVLSAAVGAGANGAASIGTQNNLAAAAASLGLRARSGGSAWVGLAVLPSSSCAAGPFSGALVEEEVVVDAANASGRAAVESSADVLLAGFGGASSSSTGTAPGGGGGAIASSISASPGRSDGLLSAAAAAAATGAGATAAPAGPLAAAAAGGGGVPSGAIQRTTSAVPMAPPPWTWSTGGLSHGSAASGGAGASSFGRERASTTGVLGGPAAAAAAAAAAGAGGGGGGGADGGGRGGSLYEGLSSYGFTASATASVAAALTGGGDPSTSLPLLRGKKVLLVEPCEMVRQVLMLALKSWGCRVCAVVNPADGIAKLLECGTLAEAHAPTIKPLQPHRPCMQLRHTGCDPSLDTSLYDTPGPYDCVILDMQDTCLLRALTRCDDREAQRLVFLGWPGQNEPEDEYEDEEEPEGQEEGGGPGVSDGSEPGEERQAGGGGRAPPGREAEEEAGPPPRRSQPGGGAARVSHDAASGTAATTAGGLPTSPYDFAEALPADVTARPPRAVTEEMSKTQNRQLGYVTVTRPVRQGRLKLALEEVLMMVLDGGPTAHQGYWSDEGEDDPVAGLPRPAPAGSGGAPVLPPRSAAVAAGGGGGASYRSMDLSGFAEELLLSPSPPVSVATSATTATIATSGTGATHPPPQQQQQQQHQLLLQPPQQPPMAAGTGHPHDVVLPQDAAAPPADASSHHQQHHQHQQHSNAEGAGLPSASALAWMRGSSSGKAPSSSPTFAAAASSAARRRDSYDPYGGMGSQSGGGGGGSSSHCGSGTGMSHGPHHGTSSLSSSLKPALVKKSGSSTELADLKPAAEGAAAAGGRVRILLAEDNAINMKVALGILKRTLPTADVVTAENGVQALDAVAARPGGIDSFDVVLMDLHMPVMGGLEAVAELQQRYPNRRCRVVAVTADAFEDTRDSCLAAGFDGWLTKPFRVEDLVRVVGEHLVAARSATTVAAASTTSSGVPGTPSAAGNSGSGSAAMGASAAQSAGTGRW